MADKTRWFIEALRDACNEALQDGMVGDQMGHIEKIEVTDPGTPVDFSVRGRSTGSPIQLKVTTFGAYSPTECRRVKEGQSVIEVADMVASYLAMRGIGLSQLKGLCDET